LTFTKDPTTSTTPYLLRPYLNQQKQLFRYYSYNANVGPENVKEEFRQRCFCVTRCGTTKPSLHDFLHNSISYLGVDLPAYITLNIEVTSSYN